jgi:hypothetical protein
MIKEGEHLGDLGLYKYDNKTDFKNMMHKFGLH